jgi:hypothetical protein
MIHDRRVALGYRIFSLAFSIIGLMAVTHAFTSDFSVSIFAYYTTQSNILGAFLFLLLSIRTTKGLREDGKQGSVSYYPSFEMVCVIDLLLTLLVFWALLAPTTFTMSSTFSPFEFSSIATHLITPLLVLLDYLLFTDSGHLRYQDVFLVLIYPLIYLALSSAAGLLGYVYRLRPDGSPVRFPYFFYDFDQIGAQALLYIGALIVFFLLLSHGFYLFDKKVRKTVLFPN